MHTVTTKREQVGAFLYQATSYFASKSAERSTGGHDNRGLSTSRHMLAVATGAEMRWLMNK